MIIADVRQRCDRRLHSSLSSFVISLRTLTEGGVRWIRLRHETISNRAQNFQRGGERFMQCSIVLYLWRSAVFTVSRRIYIKLELVSWRMTVLMVMELVKRRVKLFHYLNVTDDKIKLRIG